jgi:hypothetical protein
VSDDASTWLDVCDRFARREGVLESTAMLLRAFADPEPRGGPPPGAEWPWEGSFDALECFLVARDDIAAIAATLQQEVDDGQADMFERRVRAVDVFLEDIGDAAARVLRVGLLQRLGGILSGPRPRAARVRALADFYYSHASRHHHHRTCSAGGSVRDAVGTIRFRSIVEGLEHACIERTTGDGPLRVNVLRAHPDSIRVRTVDTRAAVEQGVTFEQHVRAFGAIAATSGGFFLYSEPDIEPPSRRYDPVGLLVDDGRVVSPPVLARGALVVTDANDILVETIGSTGVELRLSDGSGATSAWVIEEVFNRAHGLRGPDRPSIAVVGTLVVACGRSLAVPLNGFVTPLPVGVIASVGDRVHWGSVITSTGAVVRDAVAGGPMLVRDGRVQIDLRAEEFWGTAPPVTFSQDETGDQNLLPRMAAGVDDHGRLVLAAVDGRNLQRALGMTLRDLAELMLALGCRAAINLDGGSSKRMVLHDEAVDLTSTEIVATANRDPRVRPVHTAIMLVQGGHRA